MALIPKSPVELVSDEIPQMPSYTYKFDPKSKRIIGKVDGVEAVKQAVYLYLCTELGDYDIFPDEDYGIQTRDLYGKDVEFVKLIIEQRIKDALSIDTRIAPPVGDIQDFESWAEGNNVYARFTVLSSEGAFDMTYSLDLTTSKFWIE